MAQQGETNVDRFTVKVFDYDSAPDAEALYGSAYGLVERRTFASLGNAETFAEEAVRTNTNAEIWHHGKMIRQLFYGSEDC